MESNSDIKMLSQRFTDQKSSSFEYSNSILSIIGDMPQQHSFSSIFSENSEISVQNKQTEEPYTSVIIDTTEVLRLRSKEYSEKAQSRGGEEKNCIKCTTF